jgi:hypothetical protein
MTVQSVDLCTKVFYGSIELTLLALAVVFGAWFLESKQPVVHFDDVPGYRILDVTHNYLEIKWVEAALVTNCPGRVEPIFVGMHGSHALPSYPFVVEKSRKTFVRRYNFPTEKDDEGNERVYFPYGDYQLRINMISHCNPIFEGRQVLRVDFRYDPRHLMEYN